MVGLNTMITYQLSLTPEEFRLVGLALAGILPEECIEAAKELNLRLQQLRLQKDREREKISEKLVKKIET
jgi:hypothetical protein